MHSVIKIISKICNHIDAVGFSKPTLLPCFFSSTIFVQTLALVNVVRDSLDAILRCIESSYELWVY